MAAPREIGTLIAVVLKARNLPNKRHIGKQDPYCLVSLNGEKRRTKAIKRGGQHPEWDEEIRFTLYEDDSPEAAVPSTRNGSPPPPPPKREKGPPSIKGGKFMGLACYAEDLREPDLIGETKVDLTEVLTKGETDEWFTLMNKDKYCGEVYLELTFWSNEPAPAKKAIAKHKTKKHYGGPGSFVPLEGSTHSSSENLTDYSLSSRTSISSSTHSRSRRESLPPSLRASSSIAGIDLYTAPYETSRSHSSVSTFDSLTSELGQLNVSNDSSRRTSYPPASSGFQPRPASANGYPTSQSSQFTYDQYGHYSNEGSSYDYDRPPLSASATGYQFQQPQQQNAPPPQPATYHAPYETPNRPGSAYPGARGPRHSLPSASSGFMPIPTPQPSGFAPITAQNTGYYPPVPATPAPANYGPPPSHTPPNQAPPSHMYNQYPQHNAPPPAPTPTPSSSFSTMPQYSMNPAYPQSYQPPAMPPPQSTYSYQYPNVPNQVQQYAPPPTTHSAPPTMNGTGPPQSIPPPPPLPGIPPHQLTASPDNLRNGYGEPTHPQPSHISVPPPPPLTHNTSSPVSAGGGSRPLPVPGASQVRRKSSNIGQQQSGPISPSGVQPNYNAYSQVPPPPPLPTSSSMSMVPARQGPPSALPPPSVLSQPYAPASSQASAVPGPPPLPPPRAPSRAPSQSQAQPQYNHVPPRRHSVSYTPAPYAQPPPPQQMQPPSPEHQQPQSAYQAVPPPPPLSYGNGTTSHTLALAASSLQSSHPYPGPLPVPPQIPASQSAYSYPVASGGWQ